MSETPSQLDTFLKSGTPAEEAPAPVESTPPAAEPVAPPVGEEDEDPAEARVGDPIVPRAALEKERARRQNWVERASKAEAERDMLAKQLEEARKATQASAAPPPPTYEPIDPARDPEGYTRRVRGVVLNERLNTSEMMAVDKHGKEKVDSEVAYFQQRAQKDPRLWNDLYSQPHPYSWMINANELARVHDEIGTDPAAYRARVAAEERVKWEAERGAQTSPAVNMPPSLANARSAAPRGTNGFAGPPSLDDILRRPERRR